MAMDWNVTYLSQRDEMAREIYISAFAFAAAQDLALNPYGLAKESLDAATAFYNVLREGKGPPLPKADPRPPKDGSAK